MSDHWTIVQIQCNCGEMVVVEGVGRENATTCPKCKSKVWFRINPDEYYQPMVEASRGLLRGITKAKQCRSEIVGWIA